MKKIFYVFLILIFQSLILNAQTQWQETFGGTSNDWAHSIIKTTDGGYVVAGKTVSFGAGDYNVYIVKLNFNGSLQWSRVVGGTSVYDYADALSIIQTTDGGYIAAGNNYYLFSENCNMFIIKLDANGTLQWNKTVGGADWDIARSIIQTTDGGYAAVGGTESFGAVYCDVYIIKLDANGTLQWSKTVGLDWDIGASIIQTTDGGYAVAGSSGPLIGTDDNFYIIKFDANGTLQWSKTVGGTNEDDAHSIIQTSDGGYAVAGNTSSFGAGLGDMYIIKLDANGILQWTRTVGGPDYDDALSIIQTADGGYAVAGETYSFGAGSYDMYIIKLDANGILQWSRTVGGSDWDVAHSIIQTTDGCYIVAGFSESFGMKMYIVKLDGSGNTCGNSTSPASLSGTGGTTTSQNSTVSTPTSPFSILTTIVNSGGTVTTICAIGIQPISKEIPSSFSLSQNYPNPFNPSTNIKFELPKSNYVTLKIYDALGREIATLINEKLAPGTYEVEWNGSNYPSGVYFYRLITDNFSETKKMLMIK